MRVMGNAYDIGSAFDPKAFAEYGKSRGAGGITTDLVNSLLPSVQVDDPTKGIQSGVSGKTPEAPTGNPILDAFHNAGHLVGGANVAPSALDGLAGVGMAAQGTEGAADQMNILGGILTKDRNQLLKLPQAQDIITQGGSAADAAKATGWFPDQDGQWKYEIPRRNLAETPELLPKMYDALIQANTGHHTQPPQLELLRHLLKDDPLFAAFPDLASTPVEINFNNPHMTGLKGSFSAATSPAQDMGLHLGGKHQGIDSFSELQDTLQHELQHAISGMHIRAGIPMSTGGSPNQIGMEIYRALGDQGRYLKSDRDTRVGTIAKGLRDEIQRSRMNLPPGAAASSSPHYPVWNDSWNLEQALIPYMFGSKTDIETLLADPKFQTRLQAQGINRDLTLPLNDIKDMNSKLDALTPYHSDDTFKIYQALLDETNARMAGARYDYNMQQAVPFLEHRQNVYPGPYYLKFDAKRPKSELQQQATVPILNLKP